MKNNRNWFNTGEALKQLEIDRKKLFQLKRYLKPGYHFRDLSLPGALRASYQWHVARIKQFLETK